MTTSYNETSEAMILHDAWTLGALGPGVFL